MAIQIKRSTTSGSVPNPASLEVGELAVNTADAKLWTKHSNGTLVDLNPSGGPGGGTTVYSAVVEVDFGSEENSFASFDVSATWVASGSKISITPFCESTNDHDPEDYVIEGVFGMPTDLNAGVGFRLLAGCKNTTFGKYKFSIIGV